METGQSPSKVNKGMHRFVSGRSIAVLVVLILFSILVFKHLKKKKKSATKESYRYDVFLSFRGPDTRRGFAAHLYCSLVQAGCCVFRDTDNPLMGEELGSQLLDAIAQSKIFIPIISENYASSKWRLRELMHIMECKKTTSQKVLPIFYGVAPSDVRHLKGNFGKAFHWHQKHLHDKAIEEGQQALREVSDLNGWESEKIANGHFTST